MSLGNKHIDMKEELRKVLFNLNELNLSLGDLNYEDSDGIMKERHGLFHCFGDTLIYDSQQEMNLTKKVAIVEEIGTGKVFEVAPHCIKFEL